MAVFNPPVKDLEERQYLGLSKPIDVGQQKSLVSASLAGAGEIFSAVVKGADEYVKQKASEDVRNEIVPEQTAYTQDLEGTDKYVRAVAGTKSTTADSLTTPPEELPRDIKNLPQTLQTFASARASGKLSETDYFGRLNALAKDIRSRYPAGYREYIDDRVKEITGVDPANAYIKSMIADINSFITSGQEDKKHIRNLIDKNLKYPGMAGENGIAARWEKGQISGNDVRSFIGKFEMQERQDELDRQAMDKTIKGSQVSKVEAEPIANRQAVTEANNWFYRIEATSGTTVADQLEKVRTGAVPGEQAVEFGRQIEAQEGRYRQAMQKKFAEGGERSMFATLGTTAANKIIDDGASVFRMASASIFDKNYGAVNLAKQTSEAITNDTTLGLLKHKDLGPFMRSMEATKQFGAGVSEKLFTQFLTGQPNLIPAMKAWVAQQTMDHINQPAAGNGGTNTILDSVNKAVEKGIPVPEVFDQMLKIVDDPNTGLTSPKVPEEMKMNIAKALFDPANRGLLSKFENDKYSLFKRLTSDDVTKTMWELGQKDKKQWLNYMDWATQSFGQEIFRSSLRDLNDIQVRSGIVLRWDQEFHQWDVSMAPASPSEAAGGERYQAVQAFPRIKHQIDNLNAGLTSMANIAKQENADIDAWLLETMFTFGYKFDPSKPPEGIPENMIKSIADKKKLEQEEEERRKALKAKAAK